VQARYKLSIQSLDSAEEPLVTTDTHFVDGRLFGLEFYAEFVAPLAGSAVTRRGRCKARQSVGGISSQNLRYVEVLLARPWSVTLSTSTGFPLADDTRAQIANPASFLVQKILIHGRRNRDERPVLHVNSVRTIQRAAASGVVADPIRTTSRIVLGRLLPPEARLVQIARSGAPQAHVKLKAPSSEIA